GSLRGTRFLATGHPWLGASALLGPGAVLRPGPSPPQARYSASPDRADPSLGRPPGRLHSAERMVLRLQVRLAGSTISPDRAALRAGTGRHTNVGSFRSQRRRDR